MGNGGTYFSSLQLMRKLEKREGRARLLRSAEGVCPWSMKR